MTKKKPIGYTKQQTQSMKTLVERTQKDAGDYVGSGTVTEMPKKKKMKRMMDGGMASMADERMLNGGMKRKMPMPMPPRKKAGDEPRYETMPIDMPKKRIPPEVMDRIGRGVETAKQAIADRMGRAMPNGADMMDRVGRGVATAKQAIKDRMGRAMPIPKVSKPGGPAIIPDTRTPRPGMRGGGLARKGVGMALAKGGMVKANGCAKRGKTRGKMM